LMAGNKQQRDPEKERFWREAVSRRERSGVTVRQFCRDEGLRETTYHFWRRELRKRDREKNSANARSAKKTLKRKAPSPFVSVELVPTPSEIQRSTMMEIVLPAGSVVRVPEGVNLQALAGVLRVLEEPSC